MAKSEKKIFDLSSFEYKCHSGLFFFLSLLRVYLVLIIMITMTIDSLIDSSSISFFVESRRYSISNTRLNQMLLFFFVYLFLSTPIEREINNLDGA
jgi:hypothetical protein